MPKFSDIAAEYEALWDTAVVRTEKAAEVAKAAQSLRGLKPKYDEVSVATTVPWYVVGMIHSLEAGFDLNSHLHNGDSLAAVTHQVPKGHPRNGSPPFTWTASAIDALLLKGLQKVGKDAWSVERIAYELERYNGFGYRDHHPSVKSPYLWSLTNQYTKGKYVGDHQFDPNEPSKQVGAMAILKQLVADNVVSLTMQDGVPPPPPPLPRVIMERAPISCLLWPMLRPARPIRLCRVPVTPLVRSRLLQMNGGPTMLPPKRGLPTMGASIPRDRLQLLHGLLLS